MIRTRFAPSPTGFLHIGSLRTAVYAYAMAKHSAGEFLLRIEDTDRSRYVEGSTEKIYSILHTFGIKWDEGPLVGGPHGPYIQSERVALGIYQKAADKLLSEGHAFYCFCPPQTKEEIKTNHASKKLQFRDPCRLLSASQVQAKLASGTKPAIRLKVPDRETIEFTDFVTGGTTHWDSSVVDDAMLLKSDGFPTYHLAVAIDDTDMQITHVIRTTEWFPSTPIHVLIYKYLGLPRPEIGHPAVVLDPSGGKLSKRKGNVACEQFLADGYLPEALLNFIILMGWAPKDNRELFTLEEFVAAFDPSGFQKSPAVFSDTKLNWFNGQYIRSKSDTEIVQLVKPLVKSDLSQTQLTQIIPLIKDRLVKLSDVNDLIGPFLSSPSVDRSLLGDLESKAAEYLTFATAHLSALTAWSKADIEAGLVEKIKANGWKVGDFFMVLRIAIFGSRSTPPITDVMAYIGQKESLARINRVLDTD